MKYQLHNEPFPYLIIDDYFDPPVEQAVFQELAMIEGKLHDDGNRKNEETLLKKRRGAFLGEIYKPEEFNHSPFCVSNRCIIPQVVSKYRLMEEYKDNWFFYSLDFSRVTALISYYENGGYYKPHSDASIMTGLTWMYYEPKKFEGGDLIFPDYGVTIECIHNRTIFFPGMIRHAVTKMSMKPEDEGKGLGRWCLTSFTGWVENRDTQIT